MSGEHSDDTWAPTDYAMEQLAEALRGFDGEGGTCSWFSPDDQLVYTFLEHPRDVPAPEPRAPRWRHDLHAEAQRILAEPQRFLPVPELGTRGRLQAFIEGVEDPGLRRILSATAREPRGALPRVREVLHQRGHGALWRDFSAAADREMVMSWLRSVGLLSDDPRGT